MKNINRFGLSRDIPNPIKREIRQRCGFGCVFCGIFLYQYEHIDPVFSNAKTHDANNICLLCPNHHEKVTKQLISKEEVKAAYTNPQALQNGYSHDNFINLKRPCIVQLGSLHFINPIEMLKVQNSVLLGIYDDEDGLLALNGTFFDNTGSIILQINRNEWRALNRNWDVESVGKKLTIRNTLKSISLSVTSNPPHGILFDNIDMYAQGFKLVTQSDGYLSLINSNGGGFNKLKEMRTKGPIVITEAGFRIEEGSTFY